jgi:hypothetical protein
LPAARTNPEPHVGRFCVVAVLLTVPTPSWLCGLAPVLLAGVPEEYLPALHDLREFLLGHGRAGEAAALLGAGTSTRTTRTLPLANVDRGLCRCRR